MAEKLGGGRFLGDIMPVVKSIPEPILTTMKWVVIASTTALSACVSNSKDDPGIQNPTYEDAHGGIEKVAHIKLTEDNRGFLERMQLLLNHPERGIQTMIDDGSESIAMRRVKHLSQLLFQVLESDERLQTKMAMENSRDRFEDFKQQFLNNHIPKFKFADDQRWANALWKESSFNFYDNLEESIFRDPEISKKVPGGDLKDYYFQYFNDYFEVREGELRLKEKVLFALYSIQNILGRPAVVSDVTGEGAEALLDYSTIAVLRSIFQLLAKDIETTKGQVVVYGRDIVDALTSSEEFLRNVQLQANQRIAEAEKRNGYQLPDIRIKVDDFLQKTIDITNFMNGEGLEGKIQKLMERFSFTKPEDIKRAETLKQKELHNSLVSLLHEIQNSPDLQPSDKHEIRTIIIVAIDGASVFNEKLQGAALSVIRTILTSVI